MGRTLLRLLQATNVILPGLAAMRCDVVLYLDLKTAWFIV